MRVNTYSLADYTVTIKYNDDNESVTPSVVKSIIGSGYTIGGPGNNGEGSFVIHHYGILLEIILDRGYIIKT